MTWEIQMNNLGKYSAQFLVSLIHFYSCFNMFQVPDYQAAINVIPVKYLVSSQAVRFCCGTEIC